MSKKQNCWLFQTHSLVFWIVISDTYGSYSRDTGHVDNGSFCLDEFRNSFFTHNESRSDTSIEGNIKIFNGACLQISQCFDSNNVDLDMKRVAREVVLEQNSGPIDKVVA